MNNNEKIIPASHYNLNAEIAVIGALLLDNKVMDVIIEVINYDDFFDLSHSIIYETIKNVIQKGEIADPITVMALLKKTEIINIDYLVDAMNAVTGTANTKRYAIIVLEKSMLRQIAALSNDMVMAASHPMDSTQILNSVQEIVQKLSDRKNTIDFNFNSFRDLLSENVSDLQEVFAKNELGGLSGLETGIKKLDEITSGFQSSDLIVLAGRPSMGKTAFAMNVVEHIAVKLNKSVAVFSLEMQSKSLSLRMLGSNAKISSEILRSGGLNDYDWEKLSGGLGRLSDAPIYIDDTAALNAHQISARAKALKLKYGAIDLIVIDYIQLMSSIRSNKNDTRANEIAETTRALKQLAKEMKCPVLALSQLNRELEKRPNKRPMMSDLRESGAIEQDADLILFLYRDEVYHPDSEKKGTAEIIISKQRNGRIGMVETAFIGEYTRFENLYRG